MDWLIENIPAFFTWIFSWKWDSVTLPWLDANKITFGFLTGGAVYGYKWFRETKTKIIQIDREHDRLEAEAEELEKPAE